MNKKIEIEFENMDALKKYNRGIFNVGYNLGKRDALQYHNYKLIKEEDLKYAHAEIVDPSVEKRFGNGD